MSIKVQKLNLYLNSLGHTNNSPPAKHSKGTGVKIMIREVQFEGLSDANRLHSGIYLI